MKNMPHVLLLGLLFVWLPTAHSQTAEEMVSKCRPLAEARVSDEQIQVPHTFDAGICWGAFATFQTMITIVADESKPIVPIFHVCAPEDSTRSQLIKIFMNYADRHPEQYNKDYFFVALAASKEAFPCSR
jgi:hypothetical protein